MPELDVFATYRTTVFVFLAIYGVVMFASAVSRVTGWFAGNDPQKELLRLYVSYQLLSVRVATIKNELIQIALWLVVLMLIWWLHRLI